MGDLEAINVGVWQEPFSAGILELVVACHEVGSRSNSILMRFQFCTDNTF